MTQAMTPVKTPAVVCTTADALDIIERRTALFERMLAVAIESTSSSDWVDQNGKPYLQTSGAEKVARRFGVRIYDVRFEREDLSDQLGDYYLYTVTGTAAFGVTGDEITVIGTCSSRDPFFGMKNQRPKPMHEINIANIKKKAYTNFFMNAVTRLIGIRNMSWEALQSHGIARAKTAQVRYTNAPSQAASTQRAQQSQSNAQQPWWTSTYKHTEYLHARVGQHFSESLLLQLGMKPSQKDPQIYSCPATPALLDELQSEYVAAEERDDAGGAA